MIKRTQYWLAAIGIFCWLTTARADNFSSAELDAYITNAMPQWGLPGLAVAIVTNDTVAHLRGYGTRTFGAAEPVDENTIFAIGSVSKTFTSASLGLLVQEGKLNWDDRVIGFLPDFRLYSEAATHDMRVRDLLAMRSGVGPECEFLIYNSDWDRAEIIRRLRYVPADPGTAFRAGMLYRNPMMMAAGQIVPAITNQSWDEFVAARLFQPLGMTRTLTTIRDLAHFDNVATPHIMNSNGVPVTVPYRDMDNSAPPGGILSCARDMAQWLRLHLGNGVYDSRQLLSAEVLAVIRTPHTPMGSDTNTIPPAEQLAYGLGWVTCHYQGHFVLVHGGEIDGMCAYLLLVPDIRLGVATLSNAERRYGQGMELGRAAAFRVLDRMIGITNTDWNPPMLADIRQKEAEYDAAWQAIVAARRTNTVPSLPLANYAASYVSPIYGGVQVFLESGHLVYQHSVSNVYDLEHWEDDIFLGACRQPASDLRLFPPTFVTFSVANGAVTNMNDIRYDYKPASGAGPAGTPVTDNYDGDGVPDFALYEECTGNWYIRLTSADDTWVTVYFGGSGYRAVPGDYDGDGLADLVVYAEAIPATGPGRPGFWYGRLSGSGYNLAAADFGDCGYVSIPGDYDGDRRMDLALYSAAAGIWQVKLSGSDYTLATRLFGGPAYTAAAPDLDGDGRADPNLADPATGWHAALLSALDYVLVTWQE